MPPASRTRDTASSMSATVHIGTVWSPDRCRPRHRPSAGWAPPASHPRSDPALPGTPPHNFRRNDGSGQRRESEREPPATPASARRGLATLKLRSPGRGIYGDAPWRSAPGNRRSIELSIWTVTGLVSRRGVALFEASTPPAMLRRSDKRVCCVTTVAAVASAPTQLTDTPQRFPNSPLKSAGLWL